MYSYWELAVCADACTDLCSQGVFWKHVCACTCKSPLLAHSIWLPLKTLCRHRINLTVPNLFLFIGPLTPPRHALVQKSIRTARHSTSCVVVHLVHVGSHTLTPSVSVWLAAREWWQQVTLSHLISLIMAQSLLTALRTTCHVVFVCCVCVPVYRCSVYERAVQSCGLDYRSAKIWDLYIDWESGSGRQRRVMALYDRLLALPTKELPTHLEK